MQAIWQDLRYAARMFLKTPSFTLLAIMTLARGIVANTAILTVVNAVLLRPLPYARPHELVGMYLGPDNEPAESRYPFKPAEYTTLKAQNTTLADVAALSNKGWPANLTNAGEPERLQGFQVSGNLFSLLGVNAALGRTFTMAEDAPGSNRVIVLSNEL